MSRDDPNLLLFTGHHVPIINKESPFYRTFVNILLSSLNVELKIYLTDSNSNSNITD